MRRPEKTAANQVGKKDGGGEAQNDIRTIEITSMPFAIILP